MFVYIDYLSYKYYGIQVIWFDCSDARSNWESASNLPASLIEDYETNSKGEICESSTSGGQTINTTDTSNSQTKAQNTDGTEFNNQQQPAKKCKEDTQSKSESE